MYLSTIFSMWDSEIRAWRKFADGCAKVVPESKGAGGVADTGTSTSSRVYISDSVIEIRFVGSSSDACRLVGEATGRIVFQNLKTSHD